MRNWSWYDITARRRWSWGRSISRLYRRWSGYGVVLVDTLNLFVFHTSILLLLISVLLLQATAIQYLRRFYLTNSPMTYHPKQIMPCALFLATKTENYYMPLRSFIEKIPNKSTEDIIAPEFLLTQGLRFTFDVRHPFRGLEGGIMELSAVAHGEGVPGPHCPAQTASELQNALQLVPAISSSKGQDIHHISVDSRISKAHRTAREILKYAAQMTDVYFLYTPSQIWLAALLLADKPLAEFYMDVKLGHPPSPPANSDPFTILRTKLATVLASCSSTLSSYLVTQQSPDPESMKNLKRIDKKLYHCQNPEKIDLTSLNRAQKREGSSATSASLSASTSSVAAGDSVVPQSSEEAERERVAKKRRLEREKSAREGTSIFGGSLMAERRRRTERGEGNAGDGGGGASRAS
jgi:cyclin H